MAGHERTDPVRPLLETSPPLVDALDGASFENHRLGGRTADDLIGKDEATACPGRRASRSC